MIADDKWYAEAINEIADDHARWEALASLPSRCPFLRLHDAALQAWRRASARLGGEAA